VKDKILFGLFIVLAFSVGFTIGGIGKGDATVPVITANTPSSEQVLVSVGDVLDPFLEDYRGRYVALDTERAALQQELDAVKQELATFSASGETVAVLKAQVAQQQSEIGSLRASLQNTTNDSASWQQKFLNSQYSIGEAQRMLSVSQNERAELSGKMQVVNSRESDTVNGFTAEEQDAFYKVWDEWWELVVVGVD